MAMTIFLRNGTVRASQALHKDWRHALSVNLVLGYPWTIHMRVPGYKKVDPQQHFFRVLLVHVFHVTSLHKLAGDSSAYFWAHSFTCWQALITLPTAVTSFESRIDLLQSPPYPDSKIINIVISSLFIPQDLCLSEDWSLTFTILFLRDIKNLSYVCFPWLDPILDQRHLVPSSDL